MPSDVWMDEGRESSPSASSPPARRRRLASAAPSEPARYAGLADLPAELVLRIVDDHLRREGLDLRDVQPGVERLPIRKLRDTHMLRELEVLLLTEVSEAFAPARRLMFVSLPLVDREEAETALEELTADGEVAAIVRTLWLGARDVGVDEATMATYRSIIAICPRLGALHLDEGVPLYGLGPLPSSCTRVEGYNLDPTQAVRSSASCAR